MKKKFSSCYQNLGFVYSEMNIIEFKAMQIFRFSENQKDRAFKIELVQIMRKVVKIHNNIFYCKIDTHTAVTNLIRFAYEYSNEIGKRVAKLFHRENFNPNERQIEI